MKNYKKQDLVDMIKKARTEAKVCAPYSKLKKKELENHCAKLGLLYRKPDLSNMSYKEKAKAVLENAKSMPEGPERTRVMKKVYPVYEAIMNGDTSKNMREKIDRYTGAL